MIRLNIIIFILISNLSFGQSSGCYVFETAPKTVTCELKANTILRDTTIAFLPKDCNKIIFEKSQNGIWKVLFNDTLTYGIFTLSKGILNGDYYQYFSNRQLKIKATYRNGRLSGGFKEFYDSGKLSSEGHYDKRGFTGQTFDYYWNNGRIAQISQWKNSTGDPFRDVKYWDSEGNEIDRDKFSSLWFDCD
jgi:hypothetical protein